MNNKLLYDTNYDYVSWISNVSGRLFFRLTDGFNYRYDRIVGDVIHFNQEVDEKRIFFYSLLADLRDLGVEGHAKFTRIVIFATADTANCHGKVLEGNVYLIDSKRNNALRKNKEERDFLEKLVYYEKKNRIPNEQIIKDEINNLVSNKNFIIKNIKFRIQDTGIIHLKNISQQRVPKDNDADVHAAFYLLKFTFHKDRHHLNAEENIIRIIPLHNIEECKKSEEVTCTQHYFIVKSLIEGIKQYISEKRKLEKPNSKMFFNLKGILIYAQTMIDILVEYLPTEECKDFIKHEKRCLLNLTDAIDRELDKKPYKPATFYEFLPELRNFLFIPLLIFSALFAISKNSSLFDAKEFAGWVENYYGYSVLSIIIGMEIIRKFIYKDDTFFIYHVLNLPKKLLIGLKKFSYPNIKKNRFFYLISYYIFPSIINFEMGIRRSTASEKTLYYFIFTGVVCFFFYCLFLKIS